MCCLSDDEAANLLVRSLGLSKLGAGDIDHRRGAARQSHHYANLGFQQLTGYDREEVVGSNCRFLQGPKTRRSTISAIGPRRSRQAPL